MQIETNKNSLIVFLHGLARSSKSFVKTERFFEAAGYSVLNIDYPSRYFAIEVLSDKVFNELKTFDLGRFEKVHFITHSMGGIIVRQMFNEFIDEFGSEKLGRVVMLGPPNAGSEVVDKIKHWWVFKKLNGPAGQQLGTEPLGFVNQLGPVRFECGVIAGDRSINWINSLMIDGPDDGKVSVAKTKVAGMADHLVLHTTHPMMMKNLKVLGAALRFIEIGKFA